MMPSRSIPSARPRCATSSTFRATSPSPARVVTLDRNYRSTDVILEAANAVIGEASERFTKNLWTERTSRDLPRLVTVRDEAEQANYVADHVLEAREEGVALKAQAVLFRAAHHSGPLEIELTRRNIPFVKFGGLKFLDSAHVKDVLAVLRFAENPKDRVAAFRVMQLIPGIGPSAAGHALEAMERALDPALGLQFFKAPARAEADWPGFVELYSSLRAKSVLASRSGARAAVVRAASGAPARGRDDGEPISCSSSRSPPAIPSRERFLTDLTLDPPDATSDEAGPPHLDEDYLILSTIHSAKGQEWTKVFVVNAVDGCIPSDLAVGERDEIEEERRLLYVAMTRAKDSLHLVTPQRFFVHGQSARGDRHVYASRTRFITEPMLDRFARISWPPPAQAATGRAPQPDIRVDLKARMRGMWR
jgi:DNA helicase II / ATP-dependent DNA helicase PcrA